MHALPPLPPVTNAFGLPAREPAAPRHVTPAADAGQPPPARPPVTPYAVRWDEEQLPAAAQLTVRPDGNGIAYRDGERADDRDAHGVLWARLTGEPGVGRPLYPELHPRRQRAAMENLWCQVCGGPASRTDAGTLFLLPAPGTPGERWDGWPEGARYRQPPLCLECAALSRRYCPFLTGRCEAVRVRDVRPCGVWGTVFRARRDGSVTEHLTGVHIRYGGPGIGWTLAAQLLCFLRESTVVDLDTELARSGLGPVRD